MAQVAEPAVAGALSPAGRPAIPLSIVGQDGVKGKRRGTEVILGVKWDKLSE